MASLYSPPRSIASGAILLTLPKEVSRAGLRAELLMALPLTEEARQIWNVWLSFTAASLSRPKQYQRHARLYADVRAYWRQRLAALDAAGVLQPGTHIDREATSLFCFIDGIGVQTMISPEEFTPERQTLLVDALLDRLCTPTS